ncbi:unnamed protein product [Gongylonema pulchrum]|uniref:Uncharacterized protein n=1 Tax=Gongylonema pulchrum TaxID=637853 RepID=A0A183E5R0_9BILA|nr:unnamed protein product [Gongylonema pulchrum]
MTSHGGDGDEKLRSLLSTEVLSVFSVQFKQFTAVQVSVFSSGKRRLGLTTGHSDDFFDGENSPDHSSHG